MLEKAQLKWQCIVPPIGGTIDCQFNPAALSISKEASWVGEKSPNFNSPWLKFAGGDSATYSLSLFFDAHAHERNSKDVREYTNQLLQLTLRGAGRSMYAVPFSNPPMVTFTWGKITLFSAVVTKVQVTFTLFSPDGLPIRAKADVTFKQQDTWDDFVPSQNPTSRSDSRKTRRVHAGQRLDQIASEEYGDARYWRLLAEANSLDDPFSLSDGQLLVIPQDKSW
jgi:hypothetical protein